MHRTGPMYNSGLANINMAKILIKYIFRIRIIQIAAFQKIKMYEWN